MKIVLNKSIIEKAARVINKYLPKRPVYPILESIVFQFQDNTLRLIGGSIDMQIVYEYKLIERPTEGTLQDFAIRSDMLLAALRNIPEQPVKIDTEGIEGITLSHEKGQTGIKVDYDCNYPFLIAKDTFNYIKIEGTQLCKLLKRAIWSVADDEMRPVMNGIHFSVGLDLGVVATEGHVLVKQTTHNTEDCYIPKLSCFTMSKEIAQLIIDLKPDTLVTISWGEKDLIVDLGNYHIFGKVIEGRYPNYNSVIPSVEVLSNTATIERKTLIQALKSVAPFGFSGASGIGIELSFKKHKLTLSAANTGLQMWARSEVDCDYNGTDMRIGFGFKLLSLLLANMERPEILIKMQAPGRAAILTNEIEEGSQIQYLIMPMMLED